MNKGDRRAAIVTGGGTGIGFAAAEVLSHSGHDVTIIGRRRIVLEEAAGKLAGSGQETRVFVCPGDLADPYFPETAVANHLRQFGRLDCVVCSAGIYEETHCLDLDVNAWDRTIDANVRGNLMVGLSAARWMNSHKGGRIVFIGSVLMDQSEPRTLAYSASKAALASIVRSMAVDLAESDVQVNGVAPGWVRSTMTDSVTLSPEIMKKINPQRRAAEPREIAEVVRFLVLAAPRFLSGQMLTVDGGQTIRAAYV